MQRPFFGAYNSTISNFGALGAVIGHELTHGFDAAGRQFDGSGLLRDWWSPATDAAYATRTQCLIDRYSQFQAVPGVNVDGQLTLEENMADLGGLHAAYDALTAVAPSERVPPATCALSSASRCVGEES